MTATAPGTPEPENALPRISARGRGPLSSSSKAAFVWVTSAAASVVALSGLVDAVTSTHDGLASCWTWLWIALSVVAVGAPPVLGHRFPAWAGLVGVVLFFAVTLVQLAVSHAVVGAANNFILYPMVACYIGWFFSRAISRIVVGSALAASGIMVLTSPPGSLTLLWMNVAMSTVFCREAAGYLRARLDDEVSTDPLTGVRNRANLNGMIRRELERAGRTDSDFTLAILDLDDFKQINDRSGHAAGDALLREFAALLSSQARSSDSVVRIGGDEFLLILPHTNADQSMALMRRLQQRSPHPWSYGLAQAISGDTPDSLRSRADEALYAHKSARKGTTEEP